MLESALTFISFLVSLEISDTVHDFVERLDTCEEREQTWIHSNVRLSTCIKREE
jgi:hypothetical protein